MSKIMIVDDDKITVDLLKTLLEIDGFEVVTVPDGDTAYELAKDVLPDAFLVDYHLADREGTDFIVTLRADERFQHSPVIMASGLNREDEAFAAGASAFLIKPFDPGDLVDMLKDMLG
ncbi:MAG: response regulator [Chloroflexi bacterium]|nr:response regulator [Chloroflexota bacterium]